MSGLDGFNDSDVTIQWMEHRARQESEDGQEKDRQCMARHGCAVQRFYRIGTVDSAQRTVKRIRHDPSTENLLSRRGTATII